MTPEPLQDVRSSTRWRLLREFATRGDTPVSDDKDSENNGLRESAPVSAHVMGEERARGNGALCKASKKLSLVSRPRPTLRNRSLRAWL